jgi:dienelactone hydrolase
MMDAKSHIAILFFIAAVSSPATPPRFVLPAPTGRFTVGTTSWHVVDANRSESFETGSRRREVEVVAWYPAAATTNIHTAKRAPYLRETLVEAQTFASLVRSPGVYDDLGSVETHSFVDAGPTPAAQKLPVLVFSHGYTGLVSAYTALVEDLASHGFVVLSIAHPYEAVAASRADGAIVTLLDSSGAMRRDVQDVIAEWSVEDSTMATVTRAADEGEQLRLLREYFSGLSRTHAVIDRWVKDTKLVLDHLPTEPVSSIAARLAGRLDVERIGVLGHSMGGVVAGQFCLDDSRCKAGLNLDGIPQSGTMIDRRMSRPFLMVYSSRRGRQGASDVIYRRAAATYYRVDVDSTRHLDFSDMNFWGGPLNARGAHGPMSPVRAAEVTRRIVREYFEQELVGKPSRLLDGTTKLPDVHVRRLRPPPS